MNREVQVRVLGPIGVDLRNDLAVAPRGTRPRELLAVLSSRHGRPVTVDALLEQVWDDPGSTLTAAVVHTVVARLRRQLSPDLIHTTDTGYLLPSEVSVDADRFGELGMAALGALPVDREDLCRRALALWHGDIAYDNVSATLVGPERVRLGELRRGVRSTLASFLLDEDRPGGADKDAAAESLLLAHDLSTANPFDERAAVIAMRAACRMGRPGEALQRFEALRRTLRDELGVDPGPAALALHARVLAHEPDVGRGGARPPTVATASAVPFPSTPTVGREDELAETLDCLARGRRLITVTGPGGVGKSRMLADVAAALTSEDVVHIALAGHAGHSVDDLAATVSVALRVPLEGEDALTVLVRSLRSSKVVLLLDEAEWVLKPSALLAAALLAGTSAVRLVVSSRVPLQVVGEQVIELAPLATPAPDAPREQLTTSPAVRLLLTRLHDRGVCPFADPDLSSDTELRILATVASRLDGLPLALEILAGAAGATPMDRLADLVDRPLDLESDELGHPQRHTSLRRTIMWSLGRADSEDRRVLARLSVFESGFTLAAARAVAGADQMDVDRAVRRVVAQHLLAVDRTPGAVKFRLLRTVRDLAAEELTQSGELAATRALHRAWFAGLWRDVPLCDELIEHVGAGYEDYLAAMDDALSVDDDITAADIAIALGRWWLFIETPRLGLRYLRKVLVRPGTTARQRARMTIANGALEHRLVLTPDDYDDLRSTLADDPDWTCQLELLLTISAYVVGDIALGRRHLNRALDTATARATHHLPELVATRAVLDAADGDTGAAMAGAHEAMARAGHGAGVVHRVTVIPKAALALLDAGRPQEALDLLEDSTRQAARLGVRPTATIATNAGWAALALDRTDAATRWFTEAMVGPRSYVSASAMGECCIGMAAALAYSHPRPAAELLGLGHWLLDHEETALPPTLAAHDARVTGLVEATPPSRTSTADLVMTRVQQIVGGLDSSAGPNP